MTKEKNSEIKKIVFVEDEIKFQKTLKDLFRIEGFDLFSAYDGEEGLKIIKQTFPDLILLDLILPKMNGFEVLKELKGNPETSKIPVVILTNLEGIKDVEQALSLGAHTYLVKANYSLTDLLNKIKEIFNKDESRTATA